MAKPTVRNQIKDGTKELQTLMQEALREIADSLIAQVMSATKSLTPSQRIDAAKDLMPIGLRDYKAQLLSAISALSSDAITFARKEVPPAKKVKLDDFDKLPPNLRKKIKSKSDLLAEDQVSKLTKEVQFAYLTNYETTDSMNLLEQDLEEAVVDFLRGPAISSGAELTVATIISESRNAFFFADDVLEEIEAFEFVNGDPVTEICQDLSGKVFSKDDPNMLRYTPPLHWNCKSYIVPILNGNVGKKEGLRSGNPITKFEPSSKKLEEQIQFTEK